MDQKTYYQVNKERLKERARQRYHEHREAILAAKKSNYNADTKKDYNQQYYQDNKEKLKGDALSYYRDHKDSCLEAVKNYYANNKELCKTRARIRWEQIGKTEEYRSRRKEWEAKNYEGLRAYQNRYKKIHDPIRRQNDPEFLLLERLRARLRGLLRTDRVSKTRHTMELVGCSTQELVKHIENQFTTGMNWENRHLWHVDHIRPCSSFDLRDPEQQAQCFHYSNLQPLWASDNIRKRDKL